MHGDIPCRRVRRGERSVDMIRATPRHRRLQGRFELRDGREGRNQGAAEAQHSGSEELSCICRAKCWTLNATSPIVVKSSAGCRPSHKILLTESLKPFDIQAQALGSTDLLLSLEPVIEFGTRLVASFDIEFLGAAFDSFLD